jgi:hypothetical protein
MKSTFALLLLCSSLVPAMQAHAAILPDSCGKDAIIFKVKVNGSSGGEFELYRPMPDAPAAGKAQIVFLEDVDDFESFTTPTIRFGVDGEWMGATKGDSHFTIDLTPGAHQLCANWQSNNELERMKIGVDVLNLNLEAGKVYYCQVRIVREGVAGSESGDVRRSFLLSQLNEKNGKYRVKTTPATTWKMQVDEKIQKQ